MTTLAVDDLVAAARTRTGLTDLGDDWFFEPLRVLVDSLNTEARLSDLGVALTRRRLTALVADRLRLRELRRTNPEIREEQVTVAAEICGLPRTGSTLLHRLLAASPQLTSTLSWETSYPLPFPGEGTDAAERKQRAKDRAELFLRMSPEFGAIHTIEWDGPEEDVILLDRTFTSMSFDSFYRVPTYGTWLRRADQSKAYAELREWLQVLQWQNPDRAGRPWVLKSPHHLTAVDTVLDTFPECRIVMTHRSPDRAVPSYASMVATISAQYSDHVDRVAVGRYWAERFETTLRAFAEVRARRPDRFMDVRFRDMLDEPSAQAVRVLAELGFAVTDADRSAFDAYLARNREQRHGTHSYTPEDFGLTAAGLARDFAFYAEVYA